jgi:hypothetical protein
MNPALENIQDNLMQGITSLDGVLRSLSKISITTAPMGSDDRETAANLVRFGYNFRYFSEKDIIIDLAYDNLDTQPVTKTVIAYTNYKKSKLILGTMRVCFADHLELFKFFKIEKGFSWPHGDKKAGELGRFSLHPLFDVLAKGKDQVEEKNYLKSFKKRILRSMWPYGMKIMKKAGVEVPYFILSPEVAKFVTSCGVIPEKIVGAIPRTSSFSNTIRHKYSEYWKPEADVSVQPTAYIAPWNIAPLPLTLRLQEARPSPSFSTK